MFLSRFGLWLLDGGVGRSGRVHAFKGGNDSARRRVGRNAVHFRWRSTGSAIGENALGAGSYSSGLHGIAAFGRASSIITRLALLGQNALCVLSRRSGRSCRYHSWIDITRLRRLPACRRGTLRHRSRCVLLGRQGSRIQNSRGILAVGFGRNATGQHQNRQGDSRPAAR